MKKILLAALCSLLLAACLQAADTNALAPSKWAVTLGGVGLTAGPNIWNDWQWGGEISGARKIDLTLLGKPIRTDLGLRQTVAYGTVGYLHPCPPIPPPSLPCPPQKVNGWSYRTEAFWDFNLPVYKSISLFAGPNFAVLYGNNFTPSWSFGPEGGFKIGLGKLGKTSPFFYTRANYDWNLSHADSGFRVGSGVGLEF